MTGNYEWEKGGEQMEQELSLIGREIKEGLWKGYITGD